MKLIKRDNIDIQKWDALVKRSSDDFFSYSWYLDALSENWCVITNEEYSKGIAIPFTSKLGVKLGYIPVFSRYTEWLGPVMGDVFTELMNSNFKGYELRCKQQLGLENARLNVHQEIREGGERKLGSQAKRMLKKAEKKEYEIVESDDYQFALNLIGEELSGKFKGVDQNAVDRMRKLCNKALDQEALKVITIEGVGAIICLVSNKKTLYLKGTATEEGKKNGAMYYLMNHAIEFSLENNSVFDFGGSNVGGVKQFNHNLGGKDVEYFGYSKDSSPFWYKLLRKLKHRGNY